MIEIPTKLQFQTRPGDLEYRRFLSNLYTSPMALFPYYRKSPYTGGAGVAGLGAHGDTPGPPYCTDFASYQDMLNYWGVENCTTYDVAGDISGSYACVQRNAPKLVAIADFQNNCSYPPNYGPSGGGIAPVNAANPGVTPGTIMYIPAGGGTPVPYVTPSTTPAPTPTGSQSGNTPSTPAGGGSYSPHVSFATSRPGSTLFYPGDSYTVTITGGQPNTGVSVNGVHNGVSVVNNMGATDPNGNFTLSGTFDSSVIGSWTETWYVGSQSAGAFSFIVNPTPMSGTPTPTNTGGTSYPSPSSSTGGTQSGGTQSGGTQQQQPANNNSGGSTTTTGDIIPGVSNTMLAVGAGAILLLAVMGKH